MIQLFGYTRDEKLHIPWRFLLPKQLEKILGLPQHDCEDRDRDARRGVVWGLVVTGMGVGELMPVESIATPGNGNLKFTGLVGDVRSLIL